MIQSMTGFGTATKTFKSSRGTIEILMEMKTLNSKFLDLNLRSPRLYMVFDSEISKAIRTRLRRGRVDVSIVTRTVDGPSKEISVNSSQAEELHRAFDKLSKKLKLSSPVGLMELLQSPDWIESREVKINTSEEWKFLRKVLFEVLDRVIQSRMEEGRALQKAIEIQMDRFEEYFIEIGRSNEFLLEALRSRTKERVKTLFGMDGFDPQRLEQEVVLWVARSDFREEMDRIRQHLRSMREIFSGNKKSDSPEVGRRMEFFIQELQREVNTLGAKCSDASVTRQVVELKTCIERMREQIQNVE